MKTSADEIKLRFTYHPPKGNQPQKYEAIRYEALTMALLINALCPMSREKALAITKLEEAVMWANAAIARREEAPVSKPITATEILGSQKRAVTASEVCAEQERQNDYRLGFIAGRDYAIDGCKKVMAATFNDFLGVKVGGK
jgi:hypothetical protein